MILIIKNDVGYRLRVVNVDDPKTSVFEVPYGKAGNAFLNFQDAFNFTEELLLKSGTRRSAKIKT